MSVSLQMSFQMRIKFMDGMLDEVRDSAYHPLDGNQWWMQADEPFQVSSDAKLVTGALM